MAASSPKVDVTFVVRNDRGTFFSDEKGGYTTDVLQEKGMSHKVYQRLNLPEGFQLSDIPTLSETTRLLVVDCLIESPPDISEGEGLSTGLKFAEQVRKAHPGLPIWLLDPIDAGEILGIGNRTKAGRIEEVSLFDVGPFDFAEKVKDVLSKKIR